MRFKEDFIVPAATLYLYDLIKSQMDIKLGSTTET